MCPELKERFHKNHKKMNKKITKKILCRESI